MATAAVTHFDELLGTALTHDATLDLSALFDEVHDLSDLETPFSEDIWNPIKRLPANKAPGPET